MLCALLKGCPFFRSNATHLDRGAARCGRINRLVTAKQSAKARRNLPVLRIPLGRSALPAIESVRDGSNQEKRGDENDDHFGLRRSFGDGFPTCPHFSAGASVAWVLYDTPAIEV